MEEKVTEASELENRLQGTLVQRENMKYRHSEKQGSYYPIRFISAVRGEPLNLTMVILCQVTVLMSIK